MQGRIIVTGGAGFIGSNFLLYMIEKYPEYKFINIDKLTYSGNRENLKSIESKSNYCFIEEDICNKEAINEVVQEGDIVVNFAAESHVDNSILEPDLFVKTNVLGTQVLLDVARQKKAALFIQISTDEVYGSLSFDQRPSKEDDVLNPSSPYSASKAAAEMLCLANTRTYNQPIIITRSSNNFGPYQFPEKVIPLFVTNLIKGNQVPLYGDGKNVRDWIHVEENCKAIDFIIHNGKVGEIYNIGGENELQNIELTKKILEQMRKDESHIKKVTDRLGHDLRYSLNCDKLKDLGFSPKLDFEEQLEKTVNWYKENEAWWLPLKEESGKRTS